MSQIREAVGCQSTQDEAQPFKKGIEPMESREDQQTGKMKTPKKEQK